MDKEEFLNRVEGRLRFLPKRYFAIAQQLLHGKRVSTLRNPRTFSELLAVRNLQSPDSLITETTDKIAVRDYVANTVGTEHLVPVRAVINNSSEVTEEHIVAPCVIKAAHGCDMTMLVRNGETPDLATVRTTIDSWLNDDFAAVHREAPYEGLSPRVVIEDFLGDGITPPPDYKFYVFNGSVGLIQLSLDRFDDHRIAMLDQNWRFLTIAGIYPRPDAAPEAPAKLQEMISIAEKLAVPFSFTRVDLYEVDGQIYFGELTHNPGGGKLVWQPKEFDLALGELWRNGTPLPERFVVR